MLMGGDIYSVSVCHIKQMLSCLVSCAQGQGSTSIIIRLGRAISIVYDGVKSIVVMSPTGKEGRRGPDFYASH